jgi:hypothetical protein
MVSGFGKVVPEVQTSGTAPRPILASGNRDSVGGFMDSGYVQYEAAPAPVIPYGLVQLGVMLPHDQTDVPTNHGVSIIAAGKNIVDLVLPLVCALCRGKITRTAPRDTRTVHGCPDSNEAERVLVLKDRHYLAGPVRDDHVEVGLFGHAAKDLRRVWVQRVHDLFVEGDRVPFDDGRYPPD